MKRKELINTLANNFLITIALRIYNPWGGVIAMVQKSKGSLDNRLNLNLIHFHQRISFHFR